MYLIDAINPVTCLLLCKNTEVDSKSKGELKCLTSQWPASKRNKELQRNCFEFRKCHLVSNIYQIEDDTVLERHVDLIQCLVYPGVTHAVRYARTFFSVNTFPDRFANIENFK